MYFSRSFVRKPPGGVNRGQSFSAPFGSSGSLSAASGGIATEVTPFIVSTAVGRDGDGRNAAVVGQWKDGLFDCCRFGSIHPELWNAICCPQILMAQVMTRLKLDWRGDPAPRDDWQRTFRIILSLVCCYWFLTITLAPPQQSPSSSLTGSNEQNTSSNRFQTSLYHLTAWVFGLYTWIVLTKLRRVVRKRYGIQAGGNHLHFLRIAPCWEDLCVSFWCGCCSVAQMARQTCEYDHQPADCCSPTGLSLGPSTSDTDAASVGARTFQQKQQPQQLQPILTV